MYVLRLYRANDLPESVRDEVYEAYQLWNVEDIEWWDCMDYVIEVIQNDMHCEDLEFIEFDTYYNTIKIKCSIKVREWIDKEATNGEYQELIDIMNENYSVWCSVDGNSVTVETDYAPYDEEEEIVPENIIDDAITALEKALDAWVVDIGKALLKALDNEYEYLTSKECVLESLDCNEIYFNINGGRVDPDKFGLGRPFWVTTEQIAAGIVEEMQKAFVDKSKSNGRRKRQCTSP